MSINITGVIGVSNINMTAAGGPSPSGPLGSVNFPGSSYLYTGSNAALAMGTGAFTIECWFRIPSGSNALICQSSSDVGGAGGDTWWFGIINNTLYFAAHGGGSPQSTTSFSPAANQWYHIAGVRTGSGVSLYINGVSQSVSGSIASQNFTNNQFAIGAIATPYYMNGNISNLRLSTGAVYTGNFSVPTAPLTSTGSTVLLMCQEPDSFADNGPNNLSFTASGSPAAQSANPFA